MTVGGDPIRTLHEQTPSALLNARFKPEAVADALASLVGGLHVTAQDPIRAGTTGLAPPGVANTAPTNVTQDTAPPTDTTDTSGGKLSYPAGQQYGVNSPYGPRGGEFHPGVDLALPDHTTVLAATSGKVITAVNSDDPAAYNEVEIQGPNGIVTQYGHLSGVQVKVGDTVQAGQVIGASGGTPGERGAYNASGAHLHFQVMINGQTVDPLPLLAGSATPIVGDAKGKPMSPEDIAGQVLNQVTNVLLRQPPGEPNQTAQDQTAGTASGSTLTGATKGSDSDPGAIDAFLAATRQHESGGNYQIYNQSGQSDASGAYQFLSSTWKSQGGSTATAAQASPAEQDAVARKMANALFAKYHSWRLVAIAWYGGPGVADQVAAGKDPGSPSGQGGYLAYGDTIQRMMGGT